VRLETFFEKFELFVGAPDAVTKMRELILESAIRGNLALHDARDEPASSLLRRLEDESNTSENRQRLLPPVGNDAYLRTPAGWAWTRLGNTGRIFNGDSVSETGKAELAKVADGLPFIATKDVGYGRDPLNYDNGLKVPFGDRRFKVAKVHSVLICAEGGSAGRKIGLCERDVCFGNKLYANEVRAELDYRFIFYVYQAPTFFKQFSARVTGIIGGISRGELLSLPVPIPPLAEQKRIVAKVDELMALCDQLEAQQQAREELQAELTRASLARFADAPTPSNVDVIFHESYSITPADLRKCLLSLAVQGKLVAQNPEDEPVDELMARCLAERRSVHDSAATESRALDSVGALGFEIPPSWQCHLLESLLVFGPTNGYSPKAVEYETPVRSLTLTATTSGRFNGDHFKYISTEVPQDSSLWLRDGDILVQRGNTIGYVGVAAVYRGESNQFIYPDLMMKMGSVEFQVG
jgi:type I restriction enzyme S subunit